MSDHDPSTTGARPASMFPTLRYRDAEAAVKWLGEAFGFKEKEISRGENGRIVHAELRHGGSVVMLGEGDDGGGERAGLSGVYVVVAEPDAHHEGSVAAGAEITMGLTDQPYGSREYAARDPEGHNWFFGTYDPMVA
ncbi:MAG: VOC family protein [Solirubrobacterales bacterium]|nr:VOC family protein [Solirubrobacterales bacterium]